MNKSYFKMVVSAAERFAQVIPLNMPEIFLWYFEQKGVDNPERFLGVNKGANNENSTPSPLEGEGWGEGLIPKVVQSISNNSVNPEHQLSQLPSQNLHPQGQFDMNTLALLLGILQKVSFK